MSRENKGATWGRTFFGIILLTRTSNTENRPLCYPVLLLNQITLVTTDCLSHLINKGVKLLNEHILPEELKKKAIKTITNEYAWEYCDAIKLIDFLEANNYIILGGDVLKSNLEYTYDNWYFEADLVDSICKVIHESSIKAREFIVHYYNKYGNEFYYVIVTN